MLVTRPVIIRIVPDEGFIRSPFEGNASTIGCGIAWRSDTAEFNVFIIDGDGLVRWQDISYEPFMDPDFVLREGKRLLNVEIANQ